MLLESITKYINNLKDKLNEYDSNINEEFINTMEKFTSSTLVDVDQLVKFADSDLYLDLVYKDDENLINKKDELDVLKKIINSKLESDDEDLKKLFELSDDQKGFINQVCKDVDNYIEKAKTILDEKNSIEDEIKNYQDILDNINCKKKLSLQDMQLIEVSLEDSDYNTKYGVYKDIIVYNENN